MKPIDLLIAILAFSVGTFLGITLERNQPKTQPKPNKYFEFEQKYKKRLKQFHFGEINAQQYKDSIYMDVETFMIKNK